jgi:hypothetical protein
VACAELGAGVLRTTEAAGMAGQPGVLMSRLPEDQSGGDPDHQRHR